MAARPVILLNIESGRLSLLCEAGQQEARYPSTVDYPSTVESGQLSLLCEASLTLCLPHYGS